MEFILYIWLNGGLLFAAPVPTVAACQVLEEQAVQHLVEQKDRLPAEGGIVDIVTACARAPELPEHLAEVEVGA